MYIELIKEGRYRQAECDLIAEWQHIRKAALTYLEPMLRKRAAIH
jgi:hypothetical protein